MRFQGGAGRRATAALRRALRCGAQRCARAGLVAMAVALSLAAAAQAGVLAAADLQARFPPPLIVGEKMTLKEGKNEFNITISAPK